MSITLYLSEPDVDTLISAWTGLEVWRAAAQTGPYTFLVQIPYVSGQVEYSYVDTNGERPAVRQCGQQGHDPTAHERGR